MLFRSASLRGVSPAFDEMEIVVVTALTPEEITRRGGLPPGVQVFHKPIPFDELETLVRDRVGAMAVNA